MKKAVLYIQRESGIDKRAITSTSGSPVGTAAGKCPGCGAEPFLVQGGNLRRKDDRTLMADGRCVACRDPVGYIYAKPDTLFGLEEDARMLNGRCRVYY